MESSLKGVPKQKKSKTLKKKVMAPTGAFCYSSSKLKVKSSWILLLFSYLVLEISASSVNDCRGVKYAYSQKGLDQSDVPRQPRQGKVLSFMSYYY